MLVEPEEADPGDRRLADALGALADPVRLALLRQLRVPRTVGEIRVRPVHGAARGGSPERSLARQSVKQHLDQLLRIGAVETREAEREHGVAVEYVLNHQALFSLAEEFRGLARLRPAAESARATIEGSAAPVAAPLQGPCLVVVKGLEEGRTFRLDAAPGERREWVIGRKRGCPVSLDFDPYVSAENSLVVLDGGRFRVEDLPDSRNGTSVNFRPLPRGGRQELAMGDVLGVGRVLLLFRA